jgi:hypothetical protein
MRASRPTWLCISVGRDALISTLIGIKKYLNHKEENMKFIIDLIEDIREQIGNQEDYTLTAGLLKEDPNDSNTLLYAGEATLNTQHIDEVKEQLLFEIDGSDSKITVGELLPPLLISDMKHMMFELRMNVNAEYQDMEIVGFGKNDEEKRYILFIKI